MSRKPKAALQPATDPPGGTVSDRHLVPGPRPGDIPAAVPVRQGAARRLMRPYGFVDETGASWHWRSGQVVTGDVLLALEARGAPLGPAETESSVMRVKPTGRFGEDR